MPPPFRSTDARCIMSAMTETQVCHKCLRSDIHVAATRCPYCRAFLGERVPRWWGLVVVAVMIALLVIAKLIVG